MIPNLDFEEDEDTAHRSACPFCGGVVTVKGHAIEHSAPMSCEMWKTRSPEAFFEEVKKAEAKKLAQGEKRP
jgi:hypothetical protein